MTSIQSRLSLFFLLIFIIFSPSHSAIERCVQGRTDVFGLITVCLCIHRYKPEEMNVREEEAGTALLQKSGHSQDDSLSSSLFASVSMSTLNDIKNIDINGNSFGTKIDTRKSSIIESHAAAATHLVPVPFIEGFIYLAV